MVLDGLAGILSCYAEEVHCMAWNALSVVC